MNLTVRDRQARLAARGFDPGSIDGANGPKTRAAERAFAKTHGHSIQADFHPSGLHRVFWHWTAGAQGVTDYERSRYHFLIEPDGTVVDGTLKPEDNATTSPPYAAHTGRLNAGSIGVSLDAMAGAQERPFQAGSNPVTEAQVQALIELTKDLCETYDIPISPYTTLSHAEVEETLGVRQRNKWDIMWLPWFAKPRPAREVGDILRQKILELDGGSSEAEPRPTSSLSVWAWIVAVLKQLKESNS